MRFFSYSFLSFFFSFYDTAKRGGPLFLGFLLKRLGGSWILGFETQICIFKAFETSNPKGEGRAEVEERKIDI